MLTYYEITINYLTFFQNSVIIISEKGKGMVNKMNLIEQLELLRIPDSDFFGIDKETQDAYERANQMLDDCLDIVYKYFKKEEK